MCEAKKDITVAVICPDKNAYNTFLANHKNYIEKVDFVFINNLEDYKSQLYDDVMLGPLYTSMDSQMVGTMLANIFKQIKPDRTEINI